MSSRLFLQRVIVKMETTIIISDNIDNSFQIRTLLTMSYQRMSKLLKGKKMILLKGSTNFKLNK